MLPGAACVASAGIHDQEVNACRRDRDYGVARRLAKQGHVLTGTADHDG